MFLQHGEIFSVTITATVMLIQVSICLFLWFNLAISLKENVLNIFHDTNEMHRFQTRTSTL